MLQTSGAKFRERFTTLDTSTYLVSHSMGAAPLGAREALMRYWEAWAADGPEAWEGWLPEIAALADNVGRIFGGAPGTVSLCPNVSLAMAAIASALDYSAERREVVVEGLQFPSVVYVWKAWEHFGARLRCIPSQDGRTMSTDALCAAITEGTAAAVLSHAAYVSGALIDVPAIAARCRETGTLFVLDAYQTTGIVPYDVGDLGIDILVGGSHKWLCGGPGCGFVYVRPGLRERFAPALTGWMGHADPFAFEDAPIRRAAGPHRYNTGTPTIPGYLAARAGHDTILEAGVESIRAHNVELTNELVDGALARGFIIPTPLEPGRRTGWIGMDFADAGKVAHALIGERVFVDYRAGCGIRVGPHFYTTYDEIANFFRALDRVRARV